MASSAAYYTTVDLTAQAFEPLAKRNKLYVAALSPPLLVQTPPVELATSLGDADAPFAYLKPVGQFAEWLRSVEAWVVDTVIERKEEWLASRGMDDDALRHNFKSFFRDEDGGFKVKVEEDVAMFGVDASPAGVEEAVAGQSVRCVLELSRVCFGRQEFGAMWRLAQARLVDVPPCLIDDAADAMADVDGSEDGAALDADEQEFV